MPSFEQKPVLITGGAGFIGSHLAEALLAEGRPVWIVDNLSTGKEENIPAGAQLIQHDITELETIHDRLGELQIDTVYHLAAQADVNTSLRFPDQDARVNILGTLKVINFVRDFNVRKLIFASSCAVYGEPVELPLTEESATAPISPYGIGKLASEHYIRFAGAHYGFAYTIFRFGNAFGPRQSSGNEGGVIAIFADRMLRQEACTIYGDGLQTRDFVYVGDIVRALRMALDSGDNRLLAISGQREETILAIHHNLSLLTGNQLEPVMKPSRSGDVYKIYLANTLAADVIGWRPEWKLVDGLNEVVNAFRLKNKP
ncbi:MAG: NAD-dependent epimerase/dehydratase family protein [Candidatus Delongbacteria bacterium]|nr:NAD-dependent epimerase/dehydratase family protein [Candidatus Delongbacteria bacterium]